jgi:aldehyde dehydrogenase (NAD+)
MILELPPLLHVIDGTPVASADGRTLASIDPSTEQAIGEVARGGTAEIERAVAAADAARRGPWRDLTPSDRGRLLYRLADLVAGQREALAWLEACDVGKPIGAARGDIDGVVETLRYNAGAADKIEGAVIPLGERVVDFTRLEPLGVTAHIVPWNFPLGMAVRSLAPALAAGCTAVVKPAEQTPLSMLALMPLIQAAGFPPGVVNVVCGDGPEAGAPLVAHPLVRGVAFTGSVETGRAVGIAAARGMKPAVLELGGKNAMIAAADADLERVVEDALAGGFENAGQVCSAAARLLVHRDVAETVAQMLAARAGALRLGPALDDPDMGPLVSAEQQARVLGYIAAARREGARLLTGGGRPAHLARGFFVQPTVFADVDPAAVISREEVFGPVVTITAYDTDAEAVAMANAVSTGLVAGIYTRDIGRAFAMTAALETGSVWVNGWYLGGVQAPTGGLKDSGLGRERGLVGIRNFLRIKNVAIRL